MNPAGWNEFGLSKKFRVDDNMVSVTIDEVTFYREDMAFIKNLIYNVFGKGINIPAQIVSETGYSGEYYLDISPGKFKMSDDSLTTGFQIRKGNDHFFERSSKLTFREVFRKGFLTESNFVKVPYEIVKDYTVLERIVLLATLLSVSQTLVTIIKEAIYLVNEAANPLNVAVLILKAITLALWLVSVVVLLLQTFVEVKEMILPKTRYLKACSDYDLIKAGCEYMGYTFLSDYMQQFKDTYFVLPVPEAQAGKSIFQNLENELTDPFNEGYPTDLDVCKYHFDLIKEWQTVDNLKLKVKNGIVRMEPRLYFQQNASVKIPVSFTNQDKVKNEWTFNEGEKDVWRRKFGEYQIDRSDPQSPDIAGPLRAEYITESVEIPEGCEDLENLSGLSDFSSIFALMKRKDDLTLGQKLFKTLASVVDDIVNTFGAGSNLAASFEEKIGNGIIGTQYFGTTKRIYINRSTGKQPQNYLDLLSMDKKYEDCHAQDDVKSRSAIIFPPMVIPMTPETFDQIVENEYVFSEYDQELEIIELDYNEALDMRKATVVIQMYDPSGFNTKTTKLA